MEAWNNNQSFFEVLKNDKKVMKYLSVSDLKDILENNVKINKIDWIFKNKIK